MFRKGWYGGEDSRGDGRAGALGVELRVFFEDGRGRRRQAEERETSWVVRVLWLVRAAGRWPSAASGIHGAGQHHGVLTRRVARRWLQIRTIGEASRSRVNRFVAQKAAQRTLHPPRACPLSASRRYVRRAGTGSVCGRPRACALSAPGSPLSG